MTLRTPGKVLAEVFLLPEVPVLEPHYNLAPTQQLAAVRQPLGQRQRQLVGLRWGLIPNWAQDPKIGNRMINARAESAAEKGAFRSAFRLRRCLVLADGFYEWQRADGKKQPYYVTLRDGKPFAFAGLWEPWQGPDGERIESCALLTTEASERLRPIHDRMPAILDSAAYERWLDPNLQDPALLQPLLRPYPDDQLSVRPVSSWVNDPKHDGPQCVQPLA